MPTFFAFDMNSSVFTARLLSEVFVILKLLSARKLPALKLALVDSFLAFVGPIPGRRFYTRADAPTLKETTASA